jgi:translation initiation factor IF-2
MVKIVRGDEEFEEKVASMQIDHEDVKKAKKGDEVAIKVSQRTKEGAVVYKAE